MTTQHTQQDHRTCETSAALDRLQRFLDKKLEEQRKLDDIAREQQDANERLATDIAALVIASVEGKIPGVAIEPVDYGYIITRNGWQVSSIAIPRPYPSLCKNAPTHANVSVKRIGLIKGSSYNSYSFNEAEPAARHILEHILEA